MANEEVPRELLIEAMIGKLEAHEKGNINNSGGKEDISNNESKNNPRLQKRESQGITFEYPLYRKQTDTSLAKGILYWLATKGGRSEKENPHKTGRVTVSASSVEKGEPMELVGVGTPSELWTKDVPSSWFCLDFGSLRVRPTTYSLRHGGNYRGESLRTWDFQGSIDGENWVVLRRFLFLFF